MIDWKSIYNHLIEKYKCCDLIEDLYYEKHHIIPRYMGGDNSNQNLVHLPYKQHILAHYILWRLYGNIEDKIAYKMMNGQTIGGKILIQELAVKRSNESNKIEAIKTFFSNKENVDKLIEKRKNTRYKNNNGSYYSKDALNKLSLNIINNYNTFFNPTSLKKRSESMKQNAQNMPFMEFYERYIKPMEGPMHPMYGKKRPGELAGNYGKNKGIYTLIDPNGNKTNFNGIKKLIEFGFSETLARKWVNKGIIEKSPNSRKPFRWDGYELHFILNEVYGDINKQQENRKRIQ